MSYSEDGFVLVRNAVPAALIDFIDTKITGLIKEWTGAVIETTRSPEFADLLMGNRGLEQRLYDGVRKFDWLKEISLAPPVIHAVSEILGRETGLMGKIPLRIDLPLVTRELAVWHQDYWYVKGNTGTLTLWLPLQDTGYMEGCLLVMPGSHKLGILDHDAQVLGKRHFPTGIFDREVRYVETRRGDVILLHSLLLHSSGVNISNRARLSIQARYTRLDEPVDPSMGELIPTHKVIQ